MRLVLIINPAAGIGGRVGLKGSDGAEIQRRALELGAVPLAGERAAAALEILRPLSGKIELLAAPGEMGEAVARRCGFAMRLITMDTPPHKRGQAVTQGNEDLRASNPPPFGTTAEDTRRAAQAMRTAGADLILFAGGDGTARDIHAAVGDDFPVLGIPAGVKIHSAAFAVNPRSAGELAADFLAGKRLRLQEAEVLDLDEDAYRRGSIVTRLYGTLKIPYRRERIQNQKVPTPASEAVLAQAIAAEVVERMRPGLAYLLGPGTTTRAVGERLGLAKTLVGVDIVRGGELLAADVSEQRILEVLEERPLGLIVTPTGRQGFLLGRGNQQVSPDVLRRIDRRDILVICLASKIAALGGRPLLVDTGDEQIDRQLAGYAEVITGYHESSMYRIVAP